MLGWSINLFRIFGIQLAVHGTFFLLLAYVGIEGWREGGVLGLVVNIALIVIFFVCVVLHELGHSLTARRYGVVVPRILLLPIGGMAEMNYIPRQPSAEFLITIAGPAVNAAIALGLFLIVGLPPGWPLRPEYSDSVQGIAQLLLHWNLVMAAFNLLPVYPMDGGRIMRSILAIWLPYMQATWWAVMVTRVLAPLLAFVAVYFLDWWMLAILFVFILITGNAEYRQLRRREQEAAYWAEMARRVVIPPVAEGEPPLLRHGPN